MNRVTHLLAVLAVLAVVLVAGCRSQFAVESPAQVWPSEAWVATTPEEQGMQSALLAESLEQVAAQGYAIDGIVIVRHGYLVLDAGIPGDYETAELHEVYSCTKSVVSALVGIAIARDELPGLDAHLPDLFPERPMAHPENHKGAITLKHLLTMTPGLDTHDNWTYRWQGLT